MMDDQQYLFGIPNTIAKLAQRKLFVFGSLVTAIGFLSLTNAAIATYLEAVKSHYITQYVNTHWITTFFIISGGITVLTDYLHIDFLFFSAICTNLISIFIAVGAIVFDWANIHMVLQLFDNSSGSQYQWKELTLMIPQAMIAYSVIDILCCIGTVVLSFMAGLEMSNIASRYFTNLEGFRSRTLMILGILLSLSGICKQILWVCELKWLVGLRESARFMFLNYTMDEPVWNCVYILTGILNCWTAWKGGRTMAYCALPLTALSAYPAIQYLWIDYRWMLAVKLTEVVIDIPKPERVLHANITVTVIHLILITMTVVHLCRLFAQRGLPWTTLVLSLDINLKKSILFTGFLLLFAGCAFFVTDIVNIQAGTFYRLFYPSEQKLPFFLIPSGVLCLVILYSQSVGPYFIPCLMILLLLAFHSTIFHIFTYIYLTKNLYFGSTLCELFFNSRFNRCTKRVEEIGAIAHFMEATLAVSILGLSLYGTMLSGRMLNFYVLPFNDNPPASEERRRKNYTMIMQMLLSLQLALGIVTIVVLLTVSEGPLENNDPPFYIHGFIQRITFSLVLIIFPVVQLALSSNLHKHPMKAMTQLSICCIRVTDVLMQVDYRNIANLGIGWTIMTGVELFTIFLHFAVFLICAILLDSGLKRLPIFDFEDEDRDMEYSTAEPSIEMTMFEQNKSSGTSCKYEVPGKSAIITVKGNANLV